MLALGRLRQEDYWEFKASPAYIGRPHLKHLEA